MLEGNIWLKMNPDEEGVRKRLDDLLKKAEVSKSKEDLNEFKLTLDDYLDQGYKVKIYIFKYNSLVQKIYS